MFVFDNWRHILEFVSVVLGIMLFIIGFVAALIAWSRFKGLETTVELISAGNVELRELNKDLKAAMQLQEHNFRTQIEDQKNSCMDQILKLEEQINSLKSRIIDDIAKGVVEAVLKYMEAR